MADAAPAWLAPALCDAAADGGAFAIAELADERALGRGGLTLTSPAFAPGGELDPCFTADEEDAVAPPLEWTAPPPGTQELALVVESPAVDGGEPTCHWLVWGFPGQKGMLLEGEVPPRVGKNSQRNSEWLLPDVEFGGPAQHFVFQLFALDLPLTLMPGAERKDLLDNMRGHVMAAAVLTATYAGSDESDDDFDWDEDDD